MSDYSSIDPAGRVFQLLNSKVTDFGGFHTDNLKEKIIASGNMYTSRKIFQVAGASSSNELWFGSDLFTKDELIVFPPIFSAVNGGPLSCNFYFGATKQNGTGTEQLSFNVNSNYPTINQTKVILNPTTTFNGILGPEFLIKSTDVTNQSGGAGDTSYADIPFVFFPGAGWVRIVINNLGSDTAYFEYFFVWAEI